MITFFVVKYAETELAKVVVIRDNFVMNKGVVWQLDNACLRAIDGHVINVIFTQVGANFNVALINVRYVMAGAFVNRDALKEQVAMARVIV